MRQLVGFHHLVLPNVRAKLEVTSDLERFACRYCGHEHMVRRAGGVVSLLAVTEGLKQVQVGVDKTAAELAIRRLKGRDQRPSGGDGHRDG